MHYAAKGGLVLQKILYDRARIILAGFLGLIAYGRLFVTSRTPDITFNDTIYGITLLLLSVSLLSTCGKRRTTLIGRIVAGLAGCALWGMAYDWWYTLQAVTTTSILAWLGVWLFVEALSDHDC